MLNKQAGFTLVELAIVLVIIGLIVGGVLTGQTLIRNAEVRAVISEHDKLEAAINTFRGRYKGIPGDLSNATSFWGAAHATPATCYTTDSGGIATCDGNGDGRVWAPFSGLTDLHETLRFWQHLGNAELIPGTFSGVAGPEGGIDSVIGTNAPTTKFGEATWFTIYMPGMSAATIAGLGGAQDQSFPGPNGQLMIFGTLVDLGGINHTAVGPLFSPGEMMSLDQKVDDGMPGRGVVKSWAPMVAGVYMNACATSNDPMTAVYNATINSTECAIQFRRK